MEGKKVLVTGASGQIGRGLVHVLAKANEVHALARFGKPAILEEVQAKAAAVWRVDMARERPNELPTDYDVVFHEAVDWGGDDSLAAQSASFHLSCDFLADLMARNRAAVFVLGSTGSVYKPVVGTCREDETPVAGGETYVTAKIAMSQVARWVAERFGHRVVELRYWYPFAPYLPHPRAEKLMHGDILGDNPRAIHQRTYIKHHVDKTILAAEHAACPPQVINCATDEALTLGELARIGSRLTGAPLSDKAQRPGTEPGPGHVADTAKMVRLLGPSTVSTEEGFRRYLRARREGITWPEDWMFEGPMR